MKKEVNKTQQQVVLTQPDGTKRPLQMNEIIEVLKMKTNENNTLKEKISEYEQKIKQILSVIS